MNKIRNRENNEILVHCENDNTLRQSDEYDISDSEESVNFSYNEPNDVTFEITSSNLQHNLATWAVEHKITHTALRALLQKLKKHSCFSSLSLDARSLLKTPRQQEIRTVVPESYYHFGLSDSIKKILTFVNIDNISCVKIAVNIDGLPLSKSSQQQFWPILGSVFPYDNVFIIGIYHGNEKLMDTNEFLQDFVCVLMKLQKYVQMEFSSTIETYSVELQF